MSAREPPSAGFWPCTDIIIPLHRALTVLKFLLLTSCERLMLQIEQEVSTFVVSNWRHHSEFWFSKCNYWKLMSENFQAVIKVWYELICHYNTALLARHFRPGLGKGSRYLGWQFHLKDRKLSAFFSLVSWFNEHTNRPSPYVPNTSLPFFKKQLGKMPRQEAWKKLEKASRHIFVAWDSKCTSD